MNISSALAIAICVLAGGCGASRADRQDSAGSSGSATVVRGSELSGTVLDGLRTRVPSMSINTRDVRCPLIFFRGPRSIRNAGNVSVYVDGTQMGDTCILQQMSAADVDRVEIYPGGDVSQAGIQRNANGVIMVYRIRR